MKILIILKREPDALIQAVMAENGDTEHVVVDLREKQDYEILVEHIESCDKVITW